MSLTGQPAVEWTACGDVRQSATISPGRMGRVRAKLAAVCQKSHECQSAHIDAELDPTGGLVGDLGVRQYLPEDQQYEFARQSRPIPSRRNSGAQCLRPWWMGPRGEACPARPASRITAHSGKYA